MTKDEALKLALEALERCDDGERSTFKAITALREALAQPEQGPVAWGFRNADGAIYDCISPEAHAEAEGDYTVPLYTAPAQRQWVGLTDEELYETVRAGSRVTKADAWHIVENLKTKLREST